MNQLHGFTLIEILLAMIIIGILTAITVPSYQAVITQARNSQAIRDISLIANQIERYRSVNFQLPLALADLDSAIPDDPWEHPYAYLNIENGAKTGKVRRDKNMNPLNSDYDLYSLGKDGKTTTQLTGAKARDDIVRAGNGGFIGLASDH
jgi:general secretion pathway protein G